MGSVVVADEPERLHVDMLEVNKSSAATDNHPKITEPAARRARSQSTNGTSMRLIPIVRVTRDKIPLAWLDTTHIFGNISNDSHGGRVFTNYSDALADWFRGGDKASKAVQVAREKSSGRLCAIERVRYGDYAICAIGKWVPEDLVIGKTTTVQEQNTQIVETHPAANVLDVRKKRKQALDLDRWWEVSSSKNLQAPLEESAVYSPIETPKESSKPSEQTQRAAEPIEAPSSNPLRTPNNLEAMSNPFLFSPAALPGPTDPETLYERFLTQYLDAVYVQKTSLAFFAKGPLARIRTAFSGAANNDQKTSIVDLSTHLRDVILSFSVMEKKYKERLPAIVNETALGTGDEEDISIAAKKKSKKIKLKPGKDGFYAPEKLYALRWWLNGDTEVPSSAETREQQMKRRVELLRVRETLLQIVIVLEILSLEASNEWKGIHADLQAKQAHEEIRHASSAITTGVQSSIVDVEALSKPTKTRRKKRQQDLLVHLDLLIDRIAIWHSLKYESEFSTSEIDRNKDSMKTWAMDMLGAFCIDVIVPFFKNRVPEQVTMVVKKFGGPSSSPEKQRNESRKARGKTERNVAGTVNAERTVPRRSFQRTPTEGDARIPTKRVPGLVRASTDTSLLNRNNIKRESSEGPLSAIPLLRDKKPPRRDSAEKLRLLQKRTVSFSALNTSKKRKAAAEEEVRAAIESIKRPNRGELGREVADERDRRVSTASRKQGQKKILSSRTNVQVMATPKHHRKIDVFDVDDTISQPVLIVEEPQTIPSTGAASRILDSTKSIRVHDAVSETPSVSRTRKLDLFAGNHSRSHSGSLKFAKAQSQPMSAAGDLSCATSKAIFATPLKSNKWTNTNTVMPFVNASTQAGAEEIIDRRHICAGPQTPKQIDPSTPQKTTSATPGNMYASLGWDDYPVDE